MEAHKTGSARHIAGAMSGTSADGVDVAITRIEGRGLDMRATLVRHHHRPYNAALRSEIFAFRGDAGDVSSKNFLSRLAQLGREISLTYAAAVNEALAGANMTATDLAAVAAHGQTLFHEPPNTIQWFDPSLVAAEVGCPVVSDFRRADLAAGGQGAPLVPFADYILFRHPTKNRVLLNIGGIANLTYIPASGTIDQVIAFDTGPGNCLCDYLARQLIPAGCGFDDGGAMALAGTPDRLIVQEFKDDNFFYEHPPKSTDTPAMISLYERAVNRLPGHSGSSAQAQLATAAMITAYTFKTAVVILRSGNGSEAQDLVPRGVPYPDEVIASGGGIRNAAIMKYLRQALRGDWHTPLWSHLKEIGRERIDLLTTDAFGIPTDAKEAIAFALLGAATLDGVPSNVPSATGARRAVVLGSITPKP